MKDRSSLSSIATGQTWNTTDYATSGRFVATLATGVVELLTPRAGERILDLGCGDGALTEQLAATGAIVTGVDASATMVEAARARACASTIRAQRHLPMKMLSTRSSRTQRCTGYGMQDRC